MKLDNEVKKAMTDHMLKNPEEEMCGLVVESGGIMKFVPCKNSHDKKDSNFTISPNEYIKASMLGKPLAVCHSHVANGIKNLSSNDRIFQYGTGMYWVLFLNGSVGESIKIYEPIKNLKGREFDEGYLDCYDSFKDFYSLAGLEMGNYGPDEGLRIPGWYKEDGAESPFLNNIENEGFYKIKSSADLEPGDVILSLLGAKVPNHASVYVGNQHIFHHLPGRLSGCELMKSFYMKYAHSFWRHSEREKLNIDSVIDILNRS